MKEKNKGITLIALIITIIVMLILVAVSIQMVIQTGLFDAARNAGRETEGAFRNESTLGNKITIEDTEYNSVEEYVAQISCSHEWGSWEDVPATETEPAKKQRTCSKCGKTEVGMTGAEVASKASTIYGSKVTNYTAQDIEWKVFYATTDRIYLIASDYVHNSKLTNAYKNGASCYSAEIYPYSYYWSSVATSLETEGRQDELFMATGYTLGSNPNSKCVSTLLNTNNWVDFVDTDYAECAIGGPTLNMYIASWNAKGYTTLYTNTNATGYYVGTSSMPTTTSVNVASDTTGYGDTLYFPHQSGLSVCYGYWVASPSAEGNRFTMWVSYPGGVTNNFEGYYFVGVRPLVCLNSGVTLKDNNNGTVTLVN